MATALIICSALLIVFVTWRIGLRKISVFSPLCFFAAGFAYLHVFRAYLLAHRLPDYLEGKPFEFGLAVSFLSFLFLLVGYHYGNARPQHGRFVKRLHHIRARPLFLWSCFFLVLYGLSSVYLVGAYDGIWNWLARRKAYRAQVFLTPGHAHLYFGMNLFPVAYLLCWLAFRLEPRKYTVSFYTLFVYTLIVRLFFQSLISGERGALALNAALLAGPLLFTKRSRFLLLAVWFAMLGVGVYGELMGQTRGEYGFGQEEFLPTDIAESVPFQPEYADSDTAMLSYTRIYATWVTGCWNYGLSLPNTLWRLIPRAVWPGRSLRLHNVFFPARGDPVWSVFRIIVPSAGPASGGVAGAFVEFGFLFVVFWLTLGVVFRRIDRYAAWGTNPLGVVIALTVCSAAIHLVTQGVGPFYTTVLWRTAPLLVIIRLASSPAPAREKYDRSLRRWRGTNNRSVRRASRFGTDRELTLPPRRVSRALLRVRMQNYLKANRRTTGSPMN